MTNPKQITGVTKVFGVIADPISHVRAPEVFNKIFSEVGIDAVCIPMHVESKNVDAFIKAVGKWKNLSGVFVTIPHKERIFTLCDKFNKEAEVIGAVNVIRPTKNGGWHGAMYDGSGFVRAIKRHPYNLEDKKVAIFGAGGAAAAISFSILQENISTLTIVNRNLDRALQLRDKLISSSDDPSVAKKLTVEKIENVFPSFDMLINATSLGLKVEDDIPIPVALINKSTFIAEIIMKPNVTKLVKYAEKSGCQVFKGSAMFDSQVELIREYFCL